MKYWQILAGLVLTVVLFVSPLSAQAASSSSITRSAGEKIQAEDFSGQNLIGKEFTNIKLQNANFSNADLRGGVFNGTLLEDVNLHGIDFSQGIAYLAKFKNADLSDAVLQDAMMLRSTFDHVDVTGTDFSNAVLDGLEVQKLCRTASGVNSKTGVDTRESLGCR
jgi:uncharacterized protein YjbI with pentapeptide repeats